ncbi:MAG: amidohydrolase family protein [Cytophagales bacterium]|nr:amidohydrolase family protein [Cytophagales bacterium]
MTNLYRAGAKIIAGTDAGNLLLMVPGFALDEELNALSELGIPTYDVLKMTTIDASFAMNKEDEFSTMEVGKRADLLMLNSNPLKDINNWKDKHGVMLSRDLVVK